MFIQEMCFFPPLLRQDTGVTGFQSRLFGSSSAELPLRVSKLRHLRFAISVIRGEKGWRGTIAARSLLIALLTKTKGVLTYLERNPTNAHFFMYCNSALPLPPAIMWDLSTWAFPRKTGRSCKGN